MSEQYIDFGIATPPHCTSTSRPSHRLLRSRRTMADIKANEILLACAVGDLQWLKMGLYSGSNPKATNKEGLNGLHISAKNGHFDCMKYLLNNSGLDVNTLTEQGEISPLQFSVQVKNNVKMYQCMKLLLDRGADCNVKDTHGQSVLHFAAKSGNVKCLKLLLENGVNILSKDDDGKTACDIACISNNYESARLLRALHWAHNKDTTHNKKISEDRQLQRRQARHKIYQGHLAAKRAKEAYKKWLTENGYKNLEQLVPPQECERRKLSMGNPYARHSVCKACKDSLNSKQCSGSESEKDPKVIVPIKVSHHQEEKNLEPVGKPDKMHPYTNHRPESRRGCRSRKSKESISTRTTTAAHSKVGSPRGSSGYSSRCCSPSTPTQLLQVSRTRRDEYLRKKTNNNNVNGRSLTYIETLVSHIPEDATGENSQCKIGSCTAQHGMTDRMAEQHVIGVVEQHSDTDNSDPKTSDGADTESDSDGQLYPDDLDNDDIADDIIDDDIGLFHDVGEFNDLDSLSLPSALTRDRTPAELIQLLRELGGAKNTKKYSRRSSSYSYSSKQQNRNIQRRLSLGSIPEGKVVMDYAEKELETDSCIDIKFLKELERAILSSSGKGEEEGEEEEEGGEGEGEEGEGSRSSSAESSIEESEEEYSDVSMEADTHVVSVSDSDRQSLQQTLKIINFAWDNSSNSVQTRVSMTPIGPASRKTSLKVLTTSNSRQQATPSLLSASLHEKVTPQSTPPSSRATHTLYEASIVHKPAPPPHMATPPPRMATPPPRMATPPPRMATPPPCMVTPPPRMLMRRVTPPTFPSHIATPPSRKVTPPPRDVTSPPREVTPPPRKVTPPPRDVTPPSRDVTPPSRKVTPPPHKVTPPPHNVTPPSLKVTLPSRKVTPPPHNVTPPSRKVTPPSYKVTPPPHDVTPRVELVTPPPRDVALSSHKVTPPSYKTTPPPHEATPPEPCAPSYQDHLLKPPCPGVATSLAHLSASDPCLVPGRSTSPHTSRNQTPSLLSSAASANPFSIPLFYIKESEEMDMEEETRDDISAVGDNSLMALSKSPLSKSFALLSSQEVCGEVQILDCRSSSAPILKVKTRPPPLTPRSLSPCFLSIDTFGSMSSSKPSIHLGNSKTTSKTETHDVDFSKHSIFSLNNTALSQSVVLSDTDLYSMQQEAKRPISHRSSSAPNLKSSQTIGTTLFKLDDTLQ